MSRVGLIGDNSIEYIKKLIEIWNDGDCAVLIDWRIPHNTAIEMMHDASVTKCYIDKQLAGRIENTNSSDIEFIQFESDKVSAKLVPENVYDMFKSSYSKEEAVILYSSGTTGKAKGVILSHYAINLNADLVAEYMALSDNDCLYIVKTLAHASTLVGELLVGLKTHVKILISTTINNPRHALEKINEYGVTTICVNPTLLSIYTLTVNTKRMVFDCLKTIYTSGAIAEESLIEKARKAFPCTEILNVYGLSEAGPRVSAQRKGDTNSIGSVGKPLNKIDVAVVSNDGFQVAEMEKGIIHVNTPCLFSGYVLNGMLRTSLYNGWLNTGDIGYIDKNNNLFITGRVDNMITIGSHNVYPEEIETFIMKILEVNDCIIIPMKNDVHGNKMICFYVANADISHDLKEFYITNLAPYEIPSVFIRIDKIPTTDNGKKIRDVSKYSCYL